MIDPVSIGISIAKGAVGKALSKGEMPLNPKAIDFAYGNGDGVLNWEDVSYNVERAKDVVESIGDFTGDVVESIGGFIGDLFC